MPEHSKSWSISNIQLANRSFITCELSTEAICSRHVLYPYQALYSTKLFGLSVFKDKGTALNNPCWTSRTSRTNTCLRLYLGACIALYYIKLHEPTICGDLWALPVCCISGCAEHTQESVPDRTSADVLQARV